MGNRFEIKSASGRRRKGNSYSILKANPQGEIILMTMTPGKGHPEGHQSYRKDIEAQYEMYRAVAKARTLLLIDHSPNWKALQSKDEALFQKYVPDTIQATEEGCSKVVTPVISETPTKTS